MEMLLLCFLKKMHDHIIMNLVRMDQLKMSEAVVSIPGQWLVVQPFQTNSTE